jgi:hypothetical protein
MDRLRALEIEALAYSTLHVVNLSRGPKQSIGRALTRLLSGLAGRSRKGKALAVRNADALGRSAKSSA